MSNVRLPIPGEDVGSWGDILNQFLLVALNNDGTLKADEFILAKANDAEVVHTSGVETITGVKTFLAAPLVPSPTNLLHAVNKTYTDVALSAKSNTADLAQVATTGSYLDLSNIPTAQDMSAYVTTDDTRLSNTRTPTDGSVTANTIAEGVVSRVMLTSAVQAILAKAESAVQTETVTSVAGKVGDISLSKGDVGLGNVDNTSDVEKPISADMQTAINLKADGDDQRITGAIQKNTATHKGDILVASGSAAISRLGLGSDGQVLSVDSGQSSGVKWTSLVQSVVFSRSISIVTSDTAAAAEPNTDYVYIISGNHRVTLPTAFGNANRYTIKNRHSGDVSLAFADSQNADGAGVVLGANEAVDLLSTGTNWVVV